MGKEDKVLINAEEPAEYEEYWACYLPEDEAGLRRGDTLHKIGFVVPAGIPRILAFQEAMDYGNPVKRHAIFARCPKHMSRKKCSDKTSKESVMKAAEDFLKGIPEGSFLSFDISVLEILATNSTKIAVISLGSD